MKYNSKKAILFDFGDTLASTDPPYINRLAMALRKAGYNISDRDFEKAYTKADYELYKKHKRVGGISPQDHRNWFIPLVLDYLSFDEDIQEVRQKTRIEMREIGYGRKLLPGAKQLLDYLKDKNYTLGVISNNDGTTEEKCEEVGIKDYFDFIGDSTNLGLIKPDIKIFNYALEKLMLSKEDVIHIGDLFGSDVMGGLNAGIDVIWLNHRNLDGFEEGNYLEVRDLESIRSFI